MVSKKADMSQRIWVGGNGKGEEEGHEVYAQKQPLCQGLRKLLPPALVTLLNTHCTPEL